MTKNILFFLLLAININVLAMKKEEPDENFLLKTKIELSNLVNSFSILAKNITQLNENLLDDDMKALKHGFSNFKFPFKDAIGNQANKPIISFHIDSTPVLDSSVKEIIKLAAAPDIIISTQWGEFHCLKTALYGSEQLEKIIKKHEKTLHSIHAKFDESYRTPFELVLRMLHDKKVDEKMGISPREYLEFIFLSYTFLDCEKKLTSFIKTALAHIDFSEEEVAASLLDQKFDHLRDTFFVQDHLPYLPQWAMVFFLKSEDFKIDSENSMFYLLIAWAEQQSESIKKRSDLIESMLEHIDWKNIRLEYLVTVVKNLVYKYHVSNFREYYEFALCLKLVECNNQTKMVQLHSKLSPQILQALISRKPHKLSSDNANKNFVMKAVFRDISKWEMGIKYYSAGILFGGYKWFIFARPGFSQEKGQTHLATYLRAIGHGEPRHYLSVKATFSVFEKNKKPRELPSMLLEFDHYDGSIGMPINELSVPLHITLRSGDICRHINTYSYERWEDIQNGNSAIVINDTITIIVSVDYQPLNCKKLEEFIDQKFWQLDDTKFEQTE